MKKSDRIIEILTATPDLTAAAIAEQAGEEVDKTAALVSVMKSQGKLQSKPNPAGGRAKIYSVAGAGITTDKADKKPKKKKKSAPAKKAAAPIVVDDDDFLAAITYDHRLVCVDRKTGDVREYSVERTNAIADLIIQQFDAQ